MSLMGLLQVRGSEVTFERPSETGGDAVVTWTPVATVKALIDGGGGRKDGIGWEAGVQMVIAYRDDITPNMQITWGTRTFKITAPPVPDMWRHSLTISVEESV